MKLEQVILAPNTLANRPAATSVPVGTLYAATDTDTVYRSNGTTWDDYPAAIGGGGGAPSGPAGGDLSGTYPNPTIAVGAAMFPDGGGLETVSTVAAAGAAETLDLANGNVHDVTLDANCTLTLAGATNGRACTMTVILRQDGTGGRTVTWPGSVVWRSGVAPILRSAAGAFDIITLFTTDGGTTWLGFYDPPGSPVKVFDSTLTSDAASIDTGANAIPAGYDVLEVWIIAQGDNASPTVDVGIDMTLNGDTGANYDIQVVTGLNASALAQAAVAQAGWPFNTHGQGGTPQYSSVHRLTIPGYAQTTFYKVGEASTSRIDGAAANQRVDLRAVGWRNTAAINRVKVAARGAQLMKAGSRLLIYAR